MPEQPEKPMEFAPPYSLADVRVLQGRVCVKCRHGSDGLTRVGRAVARGLSGPPIPFTVRVCAECRRVQDEGSR